MKVYQELAQACGAYWRCVKSGNSEWQENWKDQIDSMLESFPSGSGFDRGAKLDLESSNDDKLVFTTSFHHMNESGMYDGWTQHVITVVPSLGLGYWLKISGRDRNRIKEHIAEVFSFELDKEVEQPKPDAQPA